MRFRVVSLVLVAAAASVVSCAGQKAQTAAADCAPVPAEFLDGGPVFRDCAVDRKASEPSRLPPLQMADRPPRQSGCSKVVIEMVVDSAGRPVTHTAKVVQSNDPLFQQAVVSGLGALKYTPAMKDKVRVAQLVRYERKVQYFTVVSSSAGGAPPSRPPRATLPDC